MRGLFYKGTYPIHMGSAFMTFMRSQRPHFLIPAPCGVGFHHVNLGLSTNHWTTAGDIHNIDAPNLCPPGEGPPGEFVRHTGEGFKDCVPGAISPLSSFILHPSMWCMYVSSSTQASHPEPSLPDDPHPQLNMVSFLLLQSPDSRLVKEDC